MVLPIPRKLEAIVSSFRFGDLPKQVKFKIEADIVTIKGYDCFVYERKGRFYVHELMTGAWMGVGKCLISACSRARRNILKTPDFDKQIEQLSLATCLEEVDAEVVFTALEFREREV